MEVSSHALALRRTDGIRFEVAAFTNLTQDHLDFHADMDDYFAAKRLLFAPAEGDPGRAPRSSTSTTATVVVSPSEIECDDLLRRRRAGRLPRRGRRVRRLGLALPLPRPVGRGPRSRCPCPGTSTSRTRSRRSPRPARSGSSSSTPPRRSPGRAGSPGRLEPVDGGPAVRGAGRLRAHPGLAGQRPARRAEADARAPDLRLRLRWRPRPRQAPADGAIGAELSDLCDRHLRQPPLGGPRGDHRGDPRRDPGWRAGGERDRRARPARRDPARPRARRRGATSS